MRVLKTKNEIEMLIASAKDLARDQSKLQQAYSNFYFGMTQPFEIIEVDFELFKTVFYEHTPKEISIKEEYLSFEIIAAKTEHPYTVKVAIDFFCRLSDEVLQFYCDLRKTVVLH